MSSKKLLKFQDCPFRTTAEFRACKKIILPWFFVQDNNLEVGKKVSLSVKAGCRRRIFTGTLCKHVATCDCCRGDVTLTVER